MFIWGVTGLTISADSGFFVWVAFLFEKYYPLFITGASTTLGIALLATGAGFIIGLLAAIVRAVPASGPLLRRVPLRLSQWLVSAYVQVFRSTPMIVQAMVIYYGMTQALGIRLNALLAGFIVVSINTGAYMAEMMRGGIQSVDPGQSEAARAIGMTHWQTMVSVVLPQAIRNILPSVGNELVVNIKDTSVLNVIGVTELFFQGKSAAGTYLRYYEVFIIISLIYLVLVSGVSALLKLIERQMDGPENYTLSASQTMPEGIIPRGGER